MSLYDARNQQSSFISSIMDLFSCLLCLLVACTSIYIFVSATRSKSKCGAGKLPPGPLPFPIIGNLLSLGNKPHESMADLAKIHGPVMSLMLGCVTTVVVTSSAMAKEVLQKKDQSFCNRTVPDAVRALNHHRHSVVWLPVSTKWRTFRKICNTEIFTSQKLDSNAHLRHQKIQDLLENVEQRCRDGDVVDIGQEAFRTTLNLLSNTIFSVDLVGADSESVQEFKELVRNMMEEAGKPNLGDYFPVIREMDPRGIRGRMGIHLGKMIEVLDKMVKQRLRLRGVEGWMDRSDVIDTLLRISEDTSNVLDIAHIDHLLLDLFAAGSDTTSNTLEWAMAELLHNPETMSRLKSELLETIGKDKQVKESDIPRLPYLQAVVKETFRMHPAAPLLLPRKVEADTELSGFVVPKDAQVLVNVWAIGRDPNLWENPNSFMPERFLGSDMDVKGQNFELIPFGAGRRICPGLPLGIRMVQLMLASLVQSYDWKLEDGVTPENMNMEDKFFVTLQKAQPLRAFPIHAWKSI